MIYYKNKSSNEIRAFNSTEEAERFINFDDFSLLSADETLKLNTPKPSRFYTEWTGTEWIDPRTEQQKAEYNRSLLPKLTKRKFQLYMLDHGLLDDVEAAIDAIEDSTQKHRMQIEYNSSDDFERLSHAVTYMAGLLGWSEEQVDQMWQQALTL
ncbi:hypothetical protein IF090_12745 [Acinetobacter towneri]|uniref:hypothetical protein n=1 Tax=Acinetobacter towneri TaxID=202956 RepID=UPI001CE117A6|nr:hypothetical protein [Acinetobacter towneri]MCA4780474.1 hypothetical protein [Acinetobacter towneri]MCA4785805.1 hypothetical protein [Acinetobacter towneri]MCA4787465.1 hypothetical protein [Acinetobacter towneri]MCA4796935.1 hypothetical protein [Acinetobacter towneri]MCA4802030.1 hypothetical protein [Acinetobacter towneri]